MRFILIFIRSAKDVNRMYFRIDNLGLGSTKHHFIGEDGKVYPRILAQMAIVGMKERKDLIEYLTDLIFFSLTTSAVKNDYGFDRLYNSLPKPLLILNPNEMIKIDDISFGYESCPPQT